MILLFVVEGFVLPNGKISRPWREGQRNLQLMPLLSLVSVGTVASSFSLKH